MVYKYVLKPSYNSTYIIYNIETYLSKNNKKSLNKVKKLFNDVAKFLDKG